MSLLFLSIEHLAREHRPSQKITALVQRCEETILLSPDQVVRLMAHADAIEKVKMREGNHDDVVVALNQGDAVAKLTIVEQRALPTHCSC